MLDRLEEQHEKLIQVAYKAPDAFDQAFLEITEIEEELSRIGDTCTGQPYWRDKDHPTRAPKLYVNHGIDEACPMHGEPEPGKRIRTYIGADEQAIEEALAAIEREEERQRLTQRLKRLQRGIIAAHSSMGHALRYVGWQMRDGQLQKARMPQW
jgi:hypothetical protein